MTDRQLTDFQRRMRTQMTTEEMKELGRTPNPPLPSADQVRLVTRFVEMEMNHRKLEPLERFRQMQATRFPDFYKTFATGLAR